jgi:hypothetical protein
MKLVNLTIKVLIGIILLTFIISLSSENKSKITSTLTSTSTITSTSQSNLNHGIFLNDKVFKYKNLKKNLGMIKSKSSSGTGSRDPTQTATPNASVNANPNNSPNPTSTQSSAEGNKDANMNKDSGSILHQGWVKYFKYYAKNGNAISYPDSFRENKQYYEQSKYFPNADLKAKKNGIYEHISDPKYFFLHLFENLVTINSSLYVNNYYKEKF